MKIAKLIVLVGGLLGIGALFLPLASVRNADGTASISGLAVIKGGDTVQADVRTADGKREKVEVAAPSDKDIDVREVRGIIAAIFAPAALLGLLGLVGLLRGRFGRAAGFFSLLLGAAGVLAGFLMYSGMGDSSGIGLLALAGGSALGAIGGLLALIAPDRGVP